MKLKNLFQYIYAIYMFDFILIACSNLQSETGNYIHTLAHVITVIGMTGIIIQKNMYCSIKRIIALSAIAFLLLINYSMSGTDHFLIAFLFIIAFEDQDFSKLIDITLGTIIIAGLIVIILENLGIIEDVVINGNRRSLGFYHPNMLGAIAIEIICLWGVKRYSRFKVYDGIGIILFSYIINYFTRNKSCLGASAVLLVLIFLFKTGKAANPFTGIAKWISKATVPLCCSVSMFSSYMYTGKGLLLWANRILTNRFLYGNLFLKNYPVSLLGQRVLITSTQSTGLNNIPAQPLDNAYVNIWVVNGVVFFILFWFFYYKSMQKLFKNREYALVIALCVYAVYGCSETYAYRCGFNFALLSFAVLLPKRRRIESFSNNLDNALLKIINKEYEQKVLHKNKFYL